MLSGGTDTAYRALLAGPHHPFTRVEVWRDGVRIDDYGDDGVPVYGGAITATLASQVTRQATLITDETLYPSDDTDMLAPYGSELRIFQGIKPGAGIPYEWQTFRGKIQDATLDDNGDLELHAADRASDVKESGFVRPDNSRVGYPVIQEWRRLVLDGVPNATFGTSDNITNLTPTLTWESDRGDACDDLADGSNSFWYALANGDYVMRIIPWTTAQTAVVEWADGPGGTLGGASPRKSREDVYNTIVVVGERADGTTPVYALAQDLDSTSPTYVGGSFGTKTLYVNVQTALNQSQALSIARSTLKYAKSLTQSWVLSMPIDASLELGDCVGVSARYLPRDVQVVVSMTIPLTPQPMTVSTTALRPGSVE